jgi:thiamine biosynthesis protein ThiS
MLKVTINGETKQLLEGSVTALLSAEGVAQDHWQALAIAQNGRVIPRGNWAETRFNEGDTIEIVKPFVGG